MFIYPLNASRRTLLLKLAQWCIDQDDLRNTLPEELEKEVESEGFCALYSHDALQGKTVAQLKVMLEEYDLFKTGKKADLIARLTRNLDCYFVRVKLNEETGTEGYFHIHWAYPKYYWWLDEDPTYVYKCSTFYDFWMEGGQLHVSEAVKAPTRATPYSRLMCYSLVEYNLGYHALVEYPYLAELKEANKAIDEESLDFEGDRTCGMHMWKQNVYHIAHGCYSDFFHRPTSSAPKRIYKEITHQVCT